MRWTAVLSALFITSVCNADAVNQITVAAVSDRVYHGLTESTENPGLVLHMATHRKNWFAGAVAEASRFDNLRERHLATTTYIGMDRELRAKGESNWLASGALRYRKFFNSNKEWDYWEFSTKLRSRNGFAVSVDYAPDYYAHNTRAIVTQIEQFHEFNNRWYGIGSAGYAEFSEAPDYGFASVGLGLRMGRSTAEVNFDWHSLDENYRFRDPVDANRVRFTWSYRLK